MEDSYEDGFDQEQQLETSTEPAPPKFQSKQHEVNEKENMIPVVSLDVPLSMIDDVSTAGALVEQL